MQVVSPRRLRDAIAEHLRDGMTRQQIENFFEDLGAMEKLGGLSLIWIRTTMQSVVLDRWELWQVTVEEHRRVASQPTAWENFQGLAVKMAGHPPKYFRRRG